MADNGNRLTGISVPGLRFAYREDNATTEGHTSNSTGAAMMVSFYSYFTANSNDSTTSPNNVFFSIDGNQGTSVFLRYWIGRPGYFSTGQLACRVHYIEEICHWRNNNPGYTIKVSEMTVQYVNVAVFSPAQVATGGSVDPTDVLNKPFVSSSGKIKFRKRFVASEANPTYVRGIAQIL